MQPLLPRKKTKRITHSECAFVASVIQHAKAQALYYIAICGQSGSTVFFAHYLTNSTMFGGKKNY